MALYFNGDLKYAQLLIFIYHLLVYLQQCQRFCIFDTIKRNCECLHPLYYDMDNLPGIAICNLNNSTIDSCVRNQILNKNASLTGDSTDCPCHQACSEAQIRTALSSASWPSEQFKVVPQVLIYTYYLIILYQDIAKVKYGFDDDVTVSYNLLKVNVFFDTLTEQIVSSDPVYQVPY